MDQINISESDFSSVFQNLSVFFCLSSDIVEVEWKMWKERNKTVDVVRTQNIYSAQ